jgi:hypothetical protein
MAIRAMMWNGVDMGLFFQDSVDVLVHVWVL